MANPRPGEVYDLGGGRANSISILEAIERIEQMTGRKLDWSYVNEAREGRSHLLYLESRETPEPLSELENYLGLETILEEIIASQRRQLAQTDEAGAWLHQVKRSPVDGRFPGRGSVTISIAVRGSQH